MLMNAEEKIERYDLCLNLRPLYFNLIGHLQLRIAKKAKVVTRKKKKEKKIAISSPLPPFCLDELSDGSALISK